MLQTFFLPEAYDLPPYGRCDRKMFWQSGGANATTANRWNTWYKPQGCSMVYMWGCSGGGGGGGGFTRASTADGAGGGGGGAAGVVRLLMAAIHVPDILYVQAGWGGLGVGSGGGTAGSGGISYVSAGPYPAGSLANLTTDNNLYLMSNAVGPTGGGTGTGTTAGAAGAAGTIAVIGSQNRGGYAMSWDATVGLVGFIGGAITDGAGAAATNALSDGVPFSGGAGGSGSTGANVAGGAVSSAGICPQLNGGNTAGLPNGCAGYELFNPFMFSTGGSGGAAIDAGAGGHGGRGGFGSGGGGGGAGTTGGTGGNGGSGLVIIIAW